ILATLSRGPRRPVLVVGFAAETDAMEANALAKLKRKGCDWIVANDVSVEGVMGGDENAVAIFSAQGVERWDRALKSDVARRLAERMAATLAG
ncbi:MAG: phosphopantothenoylcysteine decarboxylase, partial [Opitutaceae bacterium]